MRLVSFSPFRSLGIPDVLYIKPEMIFKYREEVLRADWVLFPEYWQVNLLVYAMHKRIFPSINSFHLGHNKVEMTRALWAICPSNVPRTLIIPKNERSKELILEEFEFPFVAKDIRNSQGRGVFLIENHKDLDLYIARNSTLYLQERLPIDRDLRIVVVGEGSIGAYWRIAREGEFRNNVARGGDISFEDVPEGAIKLVEECARVLGIDHAGFDVAVVEDKYYFLEFNVLFGDTALRQRGISVEKSIAEYIFSYDHPNHPTGPLPRHPIWPGVWERKAS